MNFTNENISRISPMFVDGCPVAMLQSSTKEEIQLLLRWICEFLLFGWWIKLH